MSKKALGRGIDALFRETLRESAPGSGAQGVTASGLSSIPVDRIVASSDQPRREFDEAAINELADSIRRKGVLQPIIVAPSGEGYVIVAGERRWRAARLAGMANIPAVVRDVSEQERLEIALIENLQREDLDPMEEARAYRHLMEVGHASQEEVAHLVGKDRSTVANSLRLLKLPPEAQSALSRRELSPGHARAVLSVVNPADQKSLLERIMRQGLSVRQAEELAGRMNAGGRAKAKKDPGPARRHDVALQSVEKELFDRLGTKVEIKGDRKRGCISVSYFSADDLDRIIEIIMQK
jgi:ParB family transcriptional regulator, chromosome partitioning protein